MAADPVFQWEVGHVCYLGREGQEAVDGYLKVVAHRRGQGEANGLREAARQQWRLGNRGAMWDWRESD